MTPFSHKQEYWRFLSKLGSELLAKSKAQVYSREQFSSYVLETAGIRVHYTDEGMIRAEYELVDESKFVFTVLRLA